MLHASRIFEHIRACIAAPIYSSGIVVIALARYIIRSRVRVPVPSYFENVPLHVTGPGWSGRGTSGLAPSGYHHHASGRTRTTRTCSREVTVRRQTSDALDSPRS